MISALLGWLFLAIVPILLTWPWLVILASKGAQVPHRRAWVPYLVFFFAQSLGANIVFWGSQPSGLTSYVTFAVLAGAWVFIVAVQIMAKAAIGGHGKAVVVAQQKAYQAAEDHATAAIAAMKAAGPVIPLARSRGILAERGHTSGIGSGIDILQSAENATRGTGVFGPPGSGKSFAVLGPWAGHFLTSNKNSSLFGFGIKRSWSLQLARTALFAGRPADKIVVLGVGPGRVGCSVTDGLVRLTPDAIGNVVSELVQSPGSSGGESGTFFAKSSAAFVRDVMTVANICTAVPTEDGIPTSVRLTKPAGEDGVVPPAKLITPTYDLEFLRVVMTLSPAEWRAVSGALANEAARIAEYQMHGEAEDLTIALQSLDAFFANDAKLRQNVIASVDSAISEILKAPYEFRQAFLRANPAGLNLGAILDGGGAVIVDIDLDAYPAAGRLVYRLIFAQLAQWALAREARIAAGEDLCYIGFIADEFQVIASPQSSLRFVNLSRSSRICGCYGMQSLTGLSAVIGEQNAVAIARALGTTVLMPGSSDPATLALVSLGQVDRVVESYSENEGYSNSYGGAGGSLMELGGQRGYNSGSSISRSVQRYDVLDPQVYAAMRRHLGREYGTDQWTDIVVRTAQPMRGGGQYEAAEIGWVTAWAPPADVNRPEGTPVHDVLTGRATSMRRTSAPSSPAAIIGGGEPPSGSVAIANSGAEEEPDY